MRSDAALPRQRALERQLLLFFLFSAAGWVWEVALGVVTTGQVINRGFLRGPWLPVYGVGGVLLLGLLAGGGEPPLWKRAAAWLLAAAAKFGVLYLLVVKLLCAVLPLQEPQAAAFSAMFSYPQLITALAGGAAGLFLSPLLRRASRRSPARD